MHMHIYIYMYINIYTNMLYMFVHERVFPVAILGLLDGRILDAGAFKTWSLQMYLFCTGLVAPAVLPNHL